ncbi:hypothetical protein NI389_16940 [Pseudoalteromonas xiamenensis]|uniref:hypothetical protein n=1 Tax=Pseudoalteromonas xiamenensis TaxID=882626 RepID=UPI0027E51F55|nr:hypothetical protein [Pseudoalteromonas xiamenensis]WMN59826.1 hypothetical protein NI389_16940 [Pseudoalteromonas xiamenensis]
MKEYRLFPYECSVNGYFWLKNELARPVFVYCKMKKNHMLILFLSAAKAAIKINLQRKAFIKERIVWCGFSNLKGIKNEI